MGVYVYEYFAYVRHCGCPRVTIEGAGARDRERKRDRKRERKRERWTARGGGKVSTYEEKGRGWGRAKRSLSFGRRYSRHFGKRLYVHMTVVIMYVPTERNTGQKSSKSNNIKAKTGGIKIPP